MTPPTPTNPRRTLRTWPLLGALVILGSSAASGCERSDAADRAIDKANETLEAQAIAGANPILADNKRKAAFNDVITSLNTYLNDSDPGRSGAAAILVSRAKSGLGEIAANQATDIEQQFVAQTGVSHALLDQWNSQHATAASLAKYDPRKDLEAIDMDIAARAAEAKKREADKAAQERVVAEIQGRSDSARAAAKKERDREAAIRKTAEGQSQTAREDTIRRAVEASRAADALDMQASELAAEAAKEQPKVGEISSEIERLASHGESLRKAKENIQHRAEDARKQSGEALHDADAVGKPITDSLTGLATLRQDAAGPTTEASKKYDEAAKAVQKLASASMKESKTAAFTALGAAKQSLGDLLSTKARSLAAYASTLEAMGKSIPPIPGASDVSKRAADARTELETTRTEAKTAYEDAQGAYGKAKSGGSTEVQAKLDAISKALKELNENKPAPTPEPKADAPKAEISKPEDIKPVASTLTPEQTKAVEDEVRATLRELAAASAAQDTDKIVAHIVTNSDEEKQFLIASMPVGHAAKALDTACTTKWGKDLAGLVQDCKVPAVKGNPMFMMLGAMGKQKGESSAAMIDSDAADKAAIKPVSLTEADVTVPDAPSATKFKKDGDTWKIAGLGNALAAAGPMAAQIMPMLKGLGDAFTNVGAGIKADKYPTADDMLTDLSAQLMGAMGGMGGPGGPGGRKAPGSGGTPKPPPGGGG